MIENRSGGRLALSYELASFFGTAEVGLDTGRGELSLQWGLCLLSSHCLPGYLVEPAYAISDF